MQREWFPIFSYQMKKREQEVPVAAGSVTMRIRTGGREESERTRVLVDIIELLMTLSLVFQLENLQIYLVFNPL